MIVLQGQYLMDIALQQYGMLEALLGLARINGYSVDDALAPGAELAAFAFVPPVDTYLAPANLAQEQKRSTTVYAQQNILDLVLQEHGTLEALLPFLASNGLTMENEPSPGTELMISSNTITNKAVADFFAVGGLKVSSGTRYDYVPPVLPEEPEMIDWLEEDFTTEDWL